MSVKLAKKRIKKLEEENEALRQMLEEISKLNLIGQTIKILEEPKKKKKKDPRITVTSKEDRTEYFRQYGYLSRNPDCEVIPPRKRSIRGKNHPDQRITVQRRQNRAEYGRQLAYIKRNPDCKEVPPKKLTFLG